MIERLAAVRFAVDGGGGGDHTRVHIDLEQPARVAGQAVGDRIVGRIQVKGIGRQTDRVPMTTFSSTSLAAASVSVGTETSNSSRSLMVMLKDCVWQSNHHWRPPGR